MKTKFLILYFALQSSLLSITYDRQFYPHNLQINQGDTLTITTFIVNDENVDLRGLHLTEQVHIDFSIQTISVKINGTDITNHSMLTGMQNDVYPDHIPYYWIIENPPNFPENNPIIPGSIVEIIYQLIGNQSRVYSYNKDCLFGLAGDAPFFIFDDKIRNIDTSLPVELSMFEYKIQNTGVILNWTTESEIENAGFNIYRSFGGLDFAKINNEIIEGCGSCGYPNYYQYFDTEAVQSGTYKYTLEDISYNGEISRSDTLMVLIKRDNLRIFPNPFNKELTVLFNKDIEFQVHDTVGRLVSTIKVIQGKGTWIPANISSGLYIVPERKHRKTNFWCKT